MATGDAAFDPAVGGSTPPVVLDGTGLTTTVPLLVKNGKAGSGIELQVTSTVRTGYLINDSAGVASALFGYAVSANDWITGTSASDTVLGALSTKNFRFGAIGGSTVTFTISNTNRTAQIQDTNSSVVLTSKDSATIQARCQLTNNASQNFSIGVYGNGNTVLGVTGNSIVELVASSSSALLAVYTAGSNPVIIGANNTERIRVDGTGIGFFTATPVAKQTSGANLTNNVTAGGVDDTIANFTDLTTYANDAAAIRNDIYQLARKLKQVNDAMRTYGLLT